MVLTVGTYPTQDTYPSQELRVTLSGVTALPSEQHLARPGEVYASAKLLITDFNSIRNISVLGHCCGSFPRSLISPAGDQKAIMLDETLLVDVKMVPVVTRNASEEKLYQPVYRYQTAAVQRIWIEGRPFEPLAIGHNK